MKNSIKTAKMGAKTPTKHKLRRPTYKCDECDKKFLSVQAMKTHHYCIHKIKVKPKNKGKLVNLLGKPVKRAPVKHRKDVDVEPQVSDVRKIEYECPECKQRFSVYFSAFRHIQRYHCVNNKGEKVTSNSSSIVKPVRVETCIKCQTRVRSTELHSCPNMASSMISGMDTTCICMGCQQTFPTVFMFDLHVSGLHSDGVEALFFPNLHAFTLWKEQMEAQTQVQYLVMGKCNSRQTYRCTYVPPRVAGAPAQFCPSSIVLKEYSKGVQVNFFKQHHGHSCKYKLPDRFKKYLSSEVMKKSLPGSIPGPEEDEDLYLKFKTVIDSIVFAAYNADTETLKLLLSKAGEMEKMLRSDEEPKTVKKNMTDEQITETLESLSGKPLNTDGGETKETKCDDSSLNIEKQKQLKVKDTSASPIACFNDSYKEFVDKINSKQIAEKAKLQAKTKGIKKRIVKTKIGQFKPNPSPKKGEKIDNDDEDTPLANINLVKVKTEVDYEVIEQENDYNILVLKI